MKARKIHKDEKQARQKTHTQQTKTSICCLCYFSVANGFEMQRKCNMWEGFICSFFEQKAKNKLGREIQRKSESKREREKAFSRQTGRTGGAVGLHAERQRAEGRRRACKKLINPDLRRPQCSTTLLKCYV